MNLSIYNITQYLKFELYENLKKEAKMKCNLSNGHLQSCPLLPIIFL
jgi:hypothetical protein